MNWDALQTQLPLAIAAAGQLYEPDGTTPAVYWAEQGAAFRPDVWARLQIITDLTPFPAERRHRYDPDEDAVVENVVALKELAIQVTVESISQDLRRSAVAIAGAVRSLLWSRPIRDTLRQDGHVALVGVGTVLPAPYTSREDRRQSGAILELTLRTHSVYHGANHDYVETVGISPDGLLEELEAPLWL